MKLRYKPRRSQRGSRSALEEEPNVAEVEPSAGAKRSWKEIIKGAKQELANDNLSIVAAGVAFYIFFGLIPAIGALIAIYGLIADPVTVKHQLDAMRGVLPGDVIQLLDEQMVRMIGRSSGLSWGAAFGILLSLWSGSKAMKALITGLNIAFDERETRGFVRLNLVALGLTVAGVVAAIVAIGLIVAIPIALKLLQASGLAAVAVQVLRWPLLALFAMVGLATVYRFAPDRDPIKWRWITWGAAIAALLWLAASAAFSFYVSHFGSYNKTYGSLGAVAVLMLWLMLSAYVVLLGAEVDSEIQPKSSQNADDDDQRSLERK